MKTLIYVRRRRPDKKLAFPEKNNMKFKVEWKMCI
jgi:hypothetical protein